jgi:agmatinase
VSSDQFLGIPSQDRRQADAAIASFPLEMTVSYGTGTSTGPKAILEASRQLEMFDEETLVDFSQSPKLHLLAPAMDCGDLEQYLEQIAKCASGLRDKFLLSLGGEHTMTYGVVSGLVDDLSEVTVVQIDAHADLADKLGGRHWSHGTVMRRLWERGCRLLQIGIRSLSRDEYKLASSGERIDCFYAHQLARDWEKLLSALRLLRGKVYLTIDVDGLDPAIIPSTGTPQPNGLTWAQTMEIIGCLGRSRNCQWIGSDVVEFVASPNPPGCDIIAARLAMKVLAHWWRGKQER